MVIIAGKPFVKGFEIHRVGAFLLGVHIQHGDPAGSRIIGAHRRYVGNVQRGHQAALVKVGDDQAVAVAIEIVQPFFQRRPNR